MRSFRRSEISRVVDWRLWLDENRDLSHQELADRRLQEERAHIEDANVERAYRAVAYLLAREPAEGLAASKKFLARSDVPESGATDIGWRVERAEEEVAQAAKRSRAAAPAPKAKTPPPKAPAKKPTPALTTFS